MPYILVRGNIATHNEYPWKVFVSGLKASDIEQLSRFTCEGYFDQATIVYLQHPCVVLSALEVLGYKVVASSGTVGNEDYHECIWTMRKDFSEPEPEPIVKTENTEEQPQIHKVNIEQGRVSVDPLLRNIQTIPASLHSPLQTKILQEQLLERRAFRKIAELELRRKTLEFERFQWEYEHEKTRIEKQWAHELRIMQLKEERERVIVQRDLDITE